MNRYPLRLIAPAKGVAMIVGTYSLVKPPAPWIAAHVYLGQTMVLVDTPGFVAGTRSGASPYTTRQAMEVVVRALRPRVPTHEATGSNR